MTFPKKSAVLALAALVAGHALAQKGQIKADVVAQAIRDLKIDPEKVSPQLISF